MFESLSSLLTAVRGTTERKPAFRALVELDEKQILESRRNSVKLDSIVLKKEDAVSQFHDSDSINIIVPSKRNLI